VVFPPPPAVGFWRFGGGKVEGFGIVAGTVGGGKLVGGWRVGEVEGVVGEGFGEGFVEGAGFGVEEVRGLCETLVGGAY